MKIKQVTAVFALLLISVHAIAIPSDTTILGVKISFTYSTDIFPTDWQTPTINAKGTQIDEAEINRSKSVVAKGLNKYPPVILETNLKTIYFLKSMQFYDNVGFGGTNSTDAVYLTNDGYNKGYTNSYIEQSLHHEFSSILFRNFPAFFDTTAWKSANGPGFDYNDPEAGVGAIRNNKSSQSLDSLLCKNGFLTEYALSGMENDVNTLAQNLFVPADGFWQKVEQYPRIRKKVTLLINFYSKLSGTFTESFFKKFQTP